MGIVLGVLIVCLIGAAYSGGIWLLTAPRSPALAVGRRWLINRAVRRESAELDRQYLELLERSSSN